MNRPGAKNKRTWDESLEALLAFKAKTGHCLVPIHNYVEDLALGGWVHHQRSKKEKLTDEQRQRLDDVGFAWSVRKRNKAWNVCIDKLKGYNEMHGDCDVPENYQADQQLADFVVEQRSKYQKGQLSGKRQRQLEAIGLVINLDHHNTADNASDDGSDTDQEGGNNSDADDNNETDDEEDATEPVIENDEKFQQNYQKLVDYHIKHGHCRIKLRVDSLGLWVSSLRRKYAEDPDLGGISVECQLMLDEIEFEYQGPTIATPEPTGSKSESGSDGGATSDDGEGSKVDVDDNADDDNKSVKSGSDEDGSVVSSDGGGETESEAGSDDDSVGSGGSDGSGSASSSSSSSSSGSDTDSDSEDDNGSTRKKRKKSSTVDDGGSKRKKKRRLPSSGGGNGSGSEVCNGSSNNSRDERFMTHYESLVEFKNLHGHTRVPQSNKYKTLGGWVNNLRVMHNRDPDEGVRPDRVQLLQDLGFCWDASGGRPSNDMRWNEQYKSLLAFHDEYKHCRVPQTGKHRSLGRWVATQRAQFNKDPDHGIRKDRLKRLNDIGFTWNAKNYKGKHFYKEKPRNPGDPETSPTAKDDASETESDDADDDDAMSTSSEGGGNDGDNDDMLGDVDNYDSNGNGKSKSKHTDEWYSFFHKLLEFHSKKGHSCVPSTPRYQSLRAWLDEQRAFFSDGTAAEGVNELRRKKLFDLGCTWANSKADMVQWYEEWSNLETFQKEHGHCRVSPTDAKELSLWIATQKKNKGNLDTKQIKVLNDIGLDWEIKNGKARLNDQRWDELFGQLLEYHRKHGDCLVPQKGENKKLGKWVATQRLNYNKETKGIRPERVEKLNKLGFCWNANKFKSRSIHSNGKTQSNDVTRKIKPLMTKLIGLLDKDSSKAKDSSVDGYRQSLESMISETERRLASIISRPKAPPRKEPQAILKSSVSPAKKSGKLAKPAVNGATITSGDDPLMNSTITVKTEPSILPDSKDENGMDEDVAVAEDASPSDAESASETNLLEPEITDVAVKEEPMEEESSAAGAAIVHESSMSIVKVKVESAPASPANSDPSMAAEADSSSDEQQQAKTNDEVQGMLVASSESMRQESGTEDEYM